jgi:hypothetical protein
MSVKQWTERTYSRGIIAKAGKYGGTFAHKDIAFEFASRVSLQFKSYLIREFQRLKDEEAKRLDRSAKRELAKINYHIHTDAIREHLIPRELTPKQASVIYADEADVLNVALFGITAVNGGTRIPIKKAISVTTPVSTISIYRAPPPQSLLICESRDSIA